LVGLNKSLLLDVLRVGWNEWVAMKAVI
jgi:hypothetical protein